MKRSVDGYNPTLTTTTTTKKRKTSLSDTSLFLGSDIITELLPHSTSRSMATTILSTVLGLLVVLLMVMSGPSSSPSPPSSSSSSSRHFSCDAFQLQPTLHITHPGRHRPPFSSSTSLHIFNNSKKKMDSTKTASKGGKKKPVTNNDEQTNKEKKNAFELVLLYMTPWRNPNSIFVYMFLTLYVLGKYSESHSVGGGGGGL